jgi:hypothetical protein
MTPDLMDIHKQEFISVTHSLSSNAVNGRIIDAYLLNKTNNIHFVNVEIDARKVGSVSSHGIPLLFTFITPQQWFRAVVTANVCEAQLH